MSNQIEESTNSTRPRFDSKFYKAILMRLVTEPHLCVKFKDYINPIMFDTGDGRGALKKISSVLLDWVLSDPDSQVDAEGLWGRLQLLPDGTEREQILSVYNDIRTDEEIIRFSRSDQVFKTFLQWLKATAFMQEYHGVRAKFNSGSFEDAYLNLEATLSRIKAISMDDIENAEWNTSLSFLEQESLRCDKKFLLGIDDFDIQSAFEPQTLVLFVAGTGSGKTMLTIHMIRQAVEQCKHIYVACVEDRKVSVLRRIYAAMTGIPIAEIKNLCDMPPALRAKMREISDKLEKYVTLEFMYGVPPDFVLARVKELQAIRRVKGIPDFEMVTIDYLQHIAHLSPGDSMHEKLTLSMAKCKDFALKNNVCLVTHQQVNRTGVAAQNKEGLLTLAEMSTSFQAAFVADIIISLNRTTEMREEDIAVLYVCKGREGATEQKYQIKTEFDRARFNMNDYVRLDKMG